MEEKGNNYWIVGFNLFAMVLYTIISRVTTGDDGFIYSAILIALHIILCFISSIVTVFVPSLKKTSSMWLLSALAVLLIGFSTCMAIFSGVKV